MVPETCIDCGHVTRVNGDDMGELFADDTGTRPLADEDGRPVYACLDIPACGRRQADARTRLAG